MLKLYLRFCDPSIADKKTKNIIVYIKEKNEFEIDILPVAIRKENRAISFTTMS